MHRSDQRNAGKSRSSLYFFEKKIQQFSAIRQKKFSAIRQSFLM
jgi:hypothetical protein